MLIPRILAGFLLAAFTTSSFAVTLSYPDQMKNVYDVINPGPNQNFLTSWASHEMDSVMNRWSIDLMNFLAGDISKLPRLNVIVKFDDGSRIMVDADRRTVHANYTVDENSGRDSHNNYVPATQAAATCSTGGKHGICRYSFDGDGNPNDKKRWERQMTLLGVTIQGGAGSGEHWACIMSGEESNAVYLCRRFP
jgi:hypothetical protein